MNSPLLPDDVVAPDWEKASAKWCRDCGNRIPDAKRRAQPGVQRCDECTQPPKGKGQR